MIEGKFEDTEGAEAVGFSHGDFGFVVQALNDAAGKELLSAEIVEDQLAVLTQRPSDFLYLFTGLNPNRGGPPEAILKKSWTFA